MLIEIKVKISNKEKIREIIKKLGAKFWKITTEKDTYFESKHGVFKLKQAQNGECEIIHDFRPKESITTALRIELPMDSIFSEKLLEILQDSVGIRFVLERKREQYLSHGTLLVIDEVKDHDIFLEITSDEVSEEKTIEEKQRLIVLLKNFGYSEKDLETKSYLDMYASLA